MKWLKTRRRGKNKEKQSEMIKLEKNIKFNKQKRVMKEVWTTKMESNELDTKDGISIPSHYKRYTIQALFSELFESNKNMENLTKTQRMQKELIWKNREKSPSMCT